MAIRISPADLAGCRAGLSSARGFSTIQEGDDRKEEKIDAILEAVVPKTAKSLISEIDKKFARK